MSRKACWLGVALGALGVCWGAEVAFSGSGRYLDAAAWPGGRVPGADDAVTVAPGAKLTYAGTGGVNALAQLTLGAEGEALRAAELAVSGGTLDIGGDFVMAGAGLLQLGAAGRVNASRVVRQAGGLVTCNGGTFGVSGSGRSLTGYFDNVGPIELGAAGLTFDTGDNTVWAGDLPLAGTLATTVTKAGSGTLGLSRLPSVETFAVTAGTVSAGGSRPESAKNLRHRWSFNASLDDSVGGSPAQLFKSRGPMPQMDSPAPTRSTSVVPWTADERAVALGGGAGTDMLGLGDNILPRTGPVTIELWTTLAQRTAKACAFAFGSCTSDGLVFSFTQDEAASEEGALALLGTADGSAMGASVFEEGTAYYLACVIMPTAEGGSIVSVYVRDAQTGARVGVTSLKTDWNVAALEQSGAWLGWSWADDDVAAATFDEVRIWGAALTESDIDRHVRLGPDILPGDGTSVSDNVFPENPSFALRLKNFLAHRWSFNGSWEDSVGGQTAKPAGSATLSANGRQADVGSAAGGNTEYIDLGSDILPKTGPVTIELWSTLNSYRQAWEKAFVIGGGTEDAILFTYTSEKRDGPSSFNINGNGAHSGNAQGTGLYDLGVEYYLCVSLVPRANGGTDAVARLWDTRTQQPVGVVRYSSTWTPGKLTQTYARLNDSIFWNDPNPNASYNEFRIWNAGLSEAQQRVNVQLGPDALPSLVEAQAEAVTPRVTLAAGTTLDLVGETVAVKGLAGVGTVRNGTLEVQGTLAPGGDGTVGTLTLAADTKVVGTIRLDVGDTIVCEGAIDLTQARIEIADKSNLKGLYEFLAAPAGGIKGPVKGDNLAGTGKSLTVKAESAYIVAAPIALFFR